jgi:chromosome segregation ATPase
MARENSVFIQNTMDHGLKAHSADGKLVKRFDIAKADSLTGRAVHNGYTQLTETEFDTLLKESKIFSSFLERKLLVKYDELPEDAMTPRDALVAAKREAAELSAELEKAAAENKALSDRNASLEEENARLVGRLDQAEVNGKTLAGELAAADSRNKALTDKLAAAEAAAKGKKA